MARGDDADRSDPGPRAIDNVELIHFLKREEPFGAVAEVDLARIFCDILERANDFVPSEAGSIFIDEPADGDDPQDGGPHLVLVACFGSGAERLVGTRMPTAAGIVGHVYETGGAYLTACPADDAYFYGDLEATAFVTRSVICAPLRLGGRVVGVLELLNHREDTPYSRAQLELLEIFAQTTSAFIQTAVEAQRSKEMARRDDLTGLFNDRYLHHRLTALVGECLATGEECGLIFLDLDRFKRVNDAHGHLAGSRVLAEVGGILRQVLPPRAIPARYGGDEFVVILPEAERQETYWAAETIRKTIALHVFLEHADPADPENYPALAIADLISCSIGVATLFHDVLPLLGANPHPLTAKNELIRIADLSMYRAKEAGRNATVVAEEHPHRQET